MLPKKIIISFIKLVRIGDFNYLFRNIFVGWTGKSNEE